MKSFVSNDNTSSHKRGQDGVSIKVEPTCHGVHVDAHLSWEAAEHLDCFFVALGEFKQVIQTQRREQDVVEERQAANDNVYEARKRENLEKGEKYAAELKELRNTGLDRHKALAELGRVYGQPHKDIERLISLYTRKFKAEQKEERQAKTQVLMMAGRSASEIGKELGVSKSEAHRIMKSVEETADE